MIMWPVLFRTLRVYVPYITLPFAAVIGYVGYNLENILSDKYTPYNKPIKESRNERLLDDEALNTAAVKQSLEKVKQKHSVLETNLSPSLQN